MARAWATAAESGPPNILPIHAADSPIVGILRTCERIASTDANVLITGETGTGKEVFARHIHDRSQRARGPLVPVNCGAIPETLLESELFGYVRGAFTGATQSRKGRIALAEGGTLFLDEIGEMPLQLQVKLLRVLQDRTYEPVGSNEPIEADFRLVVATNRDLQAEVDAGRFRRDLYFRLHVCPVELPALRQRPDDVALLFQHFWDKLGESRPVDPPVLEALRRYDWPGNVRELENLAERLSVCSDGPQLRLSDLPPKLRGVASAPAPTAAAPALERLLSGPTTGELAPEERSALLAEIRTPPPGLSGMPPLTAGGTSTDELPHSEATASPPEGVDAFAVQLPADLPGLLRRLEDSFIDAALAQTGGNRKAAADLLGLQRTTLVEKLRRRQPAPEKSAAPAPPGDEETP
jgi:sigma-54 specific flagellar transcriptional regulator A